LVIVQEYPWFCQLSADICHKRTETTVGLYYHYYRPKCFFYPITLSREGICRFANACHCIYCFI